MSFGYRAFSWSKCPFKLYNADEYIFYFSVHVLLYVRLVLIVYFFVLQSKSAMNSQTCKTDVFGGAGLPPLDSIDTTGGEPPSCWSRMS